jgi:hypothetical protein
MEQDNSAVPVAKITESSLETNVRDLKLDQSLDEPRHLPFSLLYSPNRWLYT